MAIIHMFDDASRIMTLISFATFMGIFAWTYVRKERDFSDAATLPFADEAADEYDIKREGRHV